MKTRFLSLFALCGLVASASLSARAIEPNPTQPSDTVSAVPASAAPQFSGRINEIVALSKSGVDQSIVLSFIKNSPGPFQPSADEIIKLRDMGVSTPVLTAMLERGGELRDQAHTAAVAPDQGSANPSQAPVISDTQPGNSAGADESAYATPPSTPPVTYIGGDYGNPYPYYPTYYVSGYYSSPFFYPFPCWFGGVFFAHGCFFPHGGFIHDGFHVHDGGHAGFHGSVTAGFHAEVSGGFHAGTVSSSGFHGSVSSFHSSPMSGGFHGSVMGGGFQGSTIGGGFHGSMGGGGFHGGTMGGGGGFHGGGGGGGGFHGGGGGGGGGMHR